MLHEIYCCSVKTESSNVKLSLNSTHKQVMQQMKMDGSVLHPRFDKGRIYFEALHLHFVLIMENTVSHWFRLVLVGFFPLGFANYCVVHELVSAVPPLLV